MLMSKNVNNDVSKDSPIDTRPQTIGRLGKDDGNDSDGDRNQ